MCTAIGRLHGLVIVELAVPGEIRLEINLMMMLQSLKGLVDLRSLTLITPIIYTKSIHQVTEKVSGRLNQLPYSRSLRKFVVRVEGTIRIEELRGWEVGLALSAKYLTETGKEILNSSSKVAEYYLKKRTIIAAIFALEKMRNAIQLNPFREEITLLIATDFLDI